MKKTITLLTALAASAGLANAATIITVANSSFETQVLADGASAAADTITGWTTETTTRSFVTNPTSTIVGVTGENVAQFTNTSISQTLSGFDVKEGDMITVTFDLWKTAGTNEQDRFRVDFAGLGLTNGGTVLSTSSLTATSFSVNFTATADITSGILLFDSTTGGHTYLIDNVTVSYTTTAVPEPSSTALLGLAGLGLILRRRR